MNKLASNLEVRVTAKYLCSKSDIENRKFAFSYVATIDNKGEQSVRLLKRHWVITDGYDEYELSGDGVVGEQPLIECNSTYSYTSGMVLNAEIGYMRGEYTMRTTSGEQFNVSIPLFRLIPPFLLH